MKNITKLFLLIITTVFIYSCEDEQFTPNLSHVAFGSETYTTGVDVGGNTTVDVEVFTSEIVNSDVTFNVAVDGKGAADGSYDVPATVMVPSGSNKGILTIGLSDVDLGIGVNKLVLSFTDVETGYGNGEATSIEYIQNCNELTGTLEIVFDGYGSETSWEITDSLGGVVMSASTGDYTDGQASVSVAVTLCGGRDFKFTINDSFGDGLSYPSNGTYTLTVDGTVKAQGGGDFGFSEETSFDTK